MISRGLESIGGVYYRFTNTGRWKHSNASRNHWCFIRQYVTENVVCDNCVKLQWYRKFTNSGCQKIQLTLGLNATNHTGKQIIARTQTITQENKQTCLGFLTSCIAALSTYMCESSMSGNSEASAVTLLLQSMDAYNNIGAKCYNFPIGILVPA